MAAATHDLRGFCCFLIQVTDQIWSVWKEQMRGEAAILQNKAIWLKSNNGRSQESKRLCSHDVENSALNGD